MEDLLKGFEDLEIDSCPLRKGSTSLASSELSVPPVPKSVMSIELCDSVGSHPSSSLIHVPLLKSRLLTKEGAFKRTWEASLGSLPDFVPGDAISIKCPNYEQEVDLLLSRLGGTDNASKEVRISSSKKIPEHLPARGTSLRELFLHALDIRTPPKKQLLRLFAEHASNESEKRRLLEVCSKQGATEYASLIREPCLSPLDVLLSFKSVSMPVVSLLEHLPRLTPRAYSLASSPLASKDSFDIVFNVVEIPSGKGRVFGRKGLCSGWLEELCSLKAAQPLIPICPRPNNKFHLSESKDPIVMVGPGTGVAPFRGFIQHLHLSKDGRKSLLLFGCRNRELDYIYRDEFEEYHQANSLCHLWTSFSRESREDKIKYVQDNIRLHQEEIVKILFEENGMFYVCGDARNMAKEVNEVLCSCVCSTLGLSEDEAKKKVTELMLNKKYLVDVW